MESEKFNLWEENWIRVRTLEGQLQEVSLEKVLLHAEHYAALAGELPTQDFAMLRLLLAVLHTALFRNPLEDGDAQEAWGNLWKQGHFPEKEILAYECQWQDRFNLFDPEKPFFQVVEMGNVKEKSVKKLNGEISESANQKRHFNVRMGSEKGFLSFSEAARWLIHYIAYDDRSLKNPDCPNLSFLGQIGGFYAIGNNLFEMLMLNLVLRNGNKSYGKNVPVWENEKILNPLANKNELLETSTPNNLAGLYTIRNRYVCLIPENNSIVNYCAKAGEWFNPCDAFSEQLTLWRKTKDGHQLPLTYQKGKQIWREFSSIAVLNSADTHQCGLINWHASLIYAEILPAEFPIRYGIVGTKYSDGNPPCQSTEDIIFDTLDLHLGILTKLGLSWKDSIKDEITRCEKIATYIRYLAKDLLDAVGITNEKKIELIGESYFKQIDIRFRRWLVSLEALKYEEQHDQKILEWRKYSRLVALNMGQKLVNEAGISAFIGRDVAEKNKVKKHIAAAPYAYNSFLYNIQKLDSKEGI